MLTLLICIDYPLLMSFFKELPPGVAQKMIEGHEDVLSNQVREEFEFVGKQTCPRCGGGVTPEQDTNRMIKGVIRPLGRCGECRCLFDPYSGIMIELGNLGYLEPAIPIIRPAED